MKKLLKAEILRVPCVIWNQINYKLEFDIFIAIWNWKNLSQCTENLFLGVIWGKMDDFNGGMRGKSVDWGIAKWHKN